MTLTEQITILVLTPASVIAVLVFLARVLLDYQISKDLEVFKKQLERSLFEYQVRFSLIHEKRAEVIGTLYGKICRTAARLAALVHIFQPGGVSLPDRKKDFCAIASDMQDYYREHQIYLSESICQKVDAMLEVLQSVWVTFDLAERGESYEPDRTGDWARAAIEFRDKWPPLKKQLDTEFQAILHVVTADPSR